MTDWIFYEGQAKDLFEEANRYGVKAKKIRLKDVKSYAKRFNLNLKTFQAAISNQKHKYKDVLPQVNSIAKKSVITPKQRVARRRNIKVARAAKKRR